jgi:steroid delta-isomerase
MPAAEALRGAALGLLLLLLTAPARADPAAAAAIRAALEDWRDAFNAGEAEAVCDIFAEDLVATYQGLPDRGREEVCAALRRALGQGSRRFHYVLDLREILVAGDLAAVRLVWTLVLRAADGTVLATQEEPGLDIFRRGPDGAWRIARFLAFPASRAR